MFTIKLNSETFQTNAMLPKINSLDVFLRSKVNKMTKPIAHNDSPDKSNRRFK